MSKNSLLNGYIARADEIIEVKDMSEAKNFIRETITVFREEIPNILRGLDYINMPEDDSDYIEDVKLIRAHLKNHRANLKSGLIKSGEKNQTINVNNLNNNTNTITINMQIEDVHQSIEDNTYIGDSEKEELLNVLKEIKELQSSQENKSKKWDKAKGILAFILDKGADIAIMYIPQILKALQ